MGKLEAILDQIRSVPEHRLNEIAQYLERLDTDPPSEAGEYYLKTELYDSVRQSSTIFDFIQEGALDGLWYWDLENPEEEWLSPRLKEVIGYRDDEVPNSSSWWQEVIFPEDLEVAVRNFHLHCADPAHPYDQVVRYRHKSGSTVWIRCRGLAIRDANGKPVRMLGAHTDVTAIKKAEQRLQAVRDAAPDMFCEVNHETGRIENCNENFAETLEFSPTELIGRTWRELCEEEGEAEFALDSLAGHGVEQSKELCLISKTGTSVPVAASAGTAPAGTLRIACRDLRHVKTLRTIELVIDSLPQAVLLVDGRGKVALANFEAETLIQRSRRDLAGTQLEGLLSDPDGTGSSQAGASDVYVIRPSGDLAPVDVQMSEIQTTEGDFVFATLVDLNERQAMEDALRRSEERFRILSESTPQLVWTCQANGDCDYLNSRWAEYTGIPAEKQLGFEWLKRVHPDDQAQTLACWNQAVETTSPFDVEYRIQAADGSYRWFNGRALPWKSPQGEISRWIGCSADIDDQKRTAAKIRSLNEDLERRVVERTTELARKNSELLETKARLEAVLTAASRASIIATDTNGVITIFNSGAEKLLQYSAAEMIGIQTPAILHVPSECEARARELSQRHGRPIGGFDLFVWDARHGSTDEREWTYVRKDGTTFDVRLAVSAVHGTDGEITGFLGIATDITARKALERELLEKNEALSAQTRRAEEANRAKSGFLASMSHEIRTPMNAIVGMADLLSDTSLEAEQREYVEVLQRAGQNLLALINDILDLSKIESGRFEIERIEFDLHDVLRRSLELVRPRVCTPEVALSLQVEPGLPANFLGDPVRLQQVLVNLLSNAAKFTKQGEIVLKAERDAAVAEGGVKFSVSDTGIGISAAKLDVIFDDFTQADGSITRRYGGTGLGLGISRRLATRMGGELTATSVEGRSSTFSFTSVFGRARSLAVHSAGPEEQLAGRRALIVDDNDTNRLIFRKNLASIGLKVTEAASATEAVRALASAQEEFALVLLDLRMPDAVGVEAVRLVREASPNIPIVALTSDDSPGDATRLQDYGVASYATKPIAREALIQAVRMASKSTNAALRAQPAVASASAEAKSILVAEDSPDNQLLVRAYLKDAGYDLKFVQDGQAAVAAFQSGAYDLVLMDVQMPIMDGLTATRVIRKFEQGRGPRRVPILALSANAFEHDRTESLAAGCDKHLSKPISKPQLLQELRQHLTLAVATACAVPAKPTLADTAAMNAEELSAFYIGRRLVEINEMRALLSRAEFVPLRRLAHNMKGAATGFGFPELSKLGAQMENSARDADAEAVLGQLNRLAAILDQQAQRGELAAEGSSGETNSTERSTYQ